MSAIGLLHYFIFLLSMVGIYAVLCLALNLQWGLAGLFNLGIAGFFAIGAYTSAILSTPAHVGYLGGYSLALPITFAAATLSSGLVAALIGWFTMRLRSDYLAIATIGIAEIIRLVLKNEDWMTNGVRGIPGIPRPFGTDNAWVLLAVVAVAVIVLYLLVERARVSPWGRVLRALRENEEGALAAGKGIARFRLEAFVVGSAFMGFAGALYAHFIGFISPEAFEPLYGTFIVWVMLIAGGSGNNVGAVLGAFVVWLIWSGSQIITDILPAGYATQAGAVRVLLIGLLLQVVLLTRPQGLLPERSPRLPVRRKREEEGDPHQ